MDPIIIRGDRRHWGVWGAVIGSLALLMGSLALFASVDWLGELLTHVFLALGLDPRCGGLQCMAHFSAVTIVVGSILGFACGLGLSLNRNPLP